ncbi:viral late gene transcription factor 2 [BeAn 58058 virus]|uniref:viral late gene transcription factor 2 n=1 Tax=BeAn 58058 virus TaxID=67082 RepID=UPI00090B9A91|nr:viral late gene transcription factor 2 [BeAn 58058 virus]APG58310.1 viral late gene transcription factor 2 [BeAn 58058 virus]
MANRLTLQDIVISSPKSVSKPIIDESISCILPRYYTTLYDSYIGIGNCNKYCWFCNQEIFIVPFFVETIKSGHIGTFCSRICRDSFATMIKSLVALREEPKISLLPLQFYDKPNEVINIINTLRNKEGVYGRAYYIESNKSVHISLRTLI